MDVEGLDSFTLARRAQIEAKRRAVMPPMTPLQRRLPAAFERPTRPERSRRLGKPAGKQASARNACRTAVTSGNTVRLSHALIQPIAADAVASTVARTAVGEPINGTIEIAGPEQFGLDELIRKGLSFRGDPREVVADPEARYYGALLEERTLLPGADALTLDPRFEDWLVQTAPQR